MSRNASNGASAGQLVGTFEAHVILGVERSRLAKWLRELDQTGRPVIPEPTARLKCGPIWTRAQVDEKLAELHELSGSRVPLGRWARERQLERGRAAGLTDAEVRAIVRPAASRVAA